MRRQGLLALLGVAACRAPSLPPPAPPAPPPVSQEDGQRVGPEVVVRATSPAVTLAEYRDGARQGWLVVVEPMETTLPVYYVELDHSAVTEGICRASAEILEHWMTVYNAALVPAVTIDADACARPGRPVVDVGAGELREDVGHTLRWDAPERAWYVDDGERGRDTSVAFFTWVPAASYEALEAVPPQPEDVVDGAVFMLIWDGRPSHLEPTVEFMAEYPDENEPI